MDGSRFDALTRGLIATGSRRRALSGLLAGALALLGGPDLQGAAAHDAKKKCKKKSGDAKKKCLTKAKRHARQHAATGGGGNVQCVGPILPPCPSGTTCEDFEFCVEGECVSDPEYRSHSRCTSSADCHGNGCYNGWCRNRCGVVICPRGCVSSSDGVAEVCLDCASDTDCPDHAPHCVNNYCGECAINAHCAPNHVCRGGRCLYGCASDADCAAALVRAPQFLSCNAGACVYNRHHVSCHTPRGGWGGA